MFGWMKRRRLEKITSSGGYPEKLAAIQAKERAANKILNATPVLTDRRWRQEIISFTDRREFDAFSAINQIVNE